MAKQYYIRKNPGANGLDVKWTAINGKEFYLRSGDGGSEENVRDQGTNTEAEAIASIVRKALNTAINSLDPES